MFFKEAHTTVSVSHKNPVELQTCWIFEVEGCGGAAWCLGLCVCVYTYIKEENVNMSVKDCPGKRLPCCGWKSIIQLFMTRLPQLN